MTVVTFLIKKSCFEKIHRKTFLPMDHIALKRKKKKELAEKRCRRWRWKRKHGFSHATSEEMKVKKKEKMLNSHSTPSSL